MKFRIAFALIAAAEACPSLAHAAEQATETRGSWFDLIFYVINFLLFVWIIRRYAGSLITGFFKDRSAGIRTTIGRAQSALDEAQQLANRANEQIARLEEERRQIASELSEETIYQTGRIYDLANEAVSRIRRDTDLTAAALHEGARRRVREALATAAGALARGLISRNFEAEDQKRLLEGFIDKLGREARQ
jgi:F-type H+-transporting ATPase subunit b